MTEKYSPQYLNDVSGLVAVVTGGGSGLGKIIANTLESNGATVYITGRRQDKLDEVVKQAKHGKIRAIQGSVNNREDVQRAVDQITTEAGYIDLLVCNAGQTSIDTSANPRTKPTAEAPISEIRDYFFNYRESTEWNRVLDINVSSVFTISMGFLELLDAGNKRRAKDLPTSQIITLGSMAGVNRWGDAFIYHASKAAVHHLMKHLATYLVPHSIRTNVIAPGWFPTEMTVPVQKMYADGVMPKALVPRERMGTEEELAGTILYLSSRAGGYTNGNVLLIDGGHIANHPATY